MRRSSSIGVGVAAILMVSAAPGLALVQDSPRDALVKLISAGSQEEALKRYAVMRKELGAEAVPGEEALNKLGRTALQDGRGEEARKLFHFVAAAYPESWNAHDSLGEALLEDGQQDAAVVAYRRSLELNPQNENAVRVLHSAATDGRLQPRTRYAARDLIRQFARSAQAQIAPRDEPGAPLTVAGVVRGADGRPVADALLYVYHTDVTGRYTRVGDDSRNPRLFAYLRTGTDGKYEFRTIRPAGYPEAQVPQHIHYEVTAPRFRTCHTELMFDDDPRMDSRAREEVRRAKFVMGVPEAQPEGGHRVVCDVTLQAE